VVDVDVLVNVAAAGVRSRLVSVVTAVSAVLMRTPRRRGTWRRGLGLARCCKSRAGGDSVRRRDENVCCESSEDKGIVDDKQRFAVPHTTQRSQVATPLPLVVIVGKEVMQKGGKGLARGN
jgi:hypothetical protein